MKLPSLKTYIDQYKFRISGLIIGLFGGYWGALLGFVAGFFIEKIYEATKKYHFVAQDLENPGFHNEEPHVEPFEGASYICGLLVYCLGNPNLAARQMKTVFAYDSDWFFFCKTASETQSLNGDLLTECLAAKIGKKNNQHVIPKIFQVLQAAEYNWNYDRGSKPSEYLSKLLDYQPASEDTKNAYAMLGVKESDSLKFIKRVHRQLAIQYHPDNFYSFTEEQKKIAAQTFIRIQAAYNHIIDIRKNA